MPQVEVTAPATPSTQPALAPSQAVLGQTQALDQARQTIFTSIDANSFEIDENTVNDLPQGTNTPLDKVSLQAPAQDSAASGDLHIRNEHANDQYRIDGILLPDGVSGFGQVLETTFIGSMALLDGALPAEYALHTAALVDITTRSGTYEPGGSVSLYGGSHATITPYMDYRGTIGQTQLFATGRLLTDNVGIENPPRIMTPFTI